MWNWNSRNVILKKIQHIVSGAVPTGLLWGRTQLQLMNLLNCLFTTYTTDTLLYCQELGSIFKSMERVNRWRNMHNLTWFFRKLSLHCEGWSAGIPLEQRPVHPSSCGDDLDHNTSFVHELERLVCNFIQETLPQIKNIEYWINGCAGQYKNFKNLMNLCNHVNAFGFHAIRSFFATSHGKSLVVVLEEQWRGR